jgi:CHASE1-domain containing sensor protein
MTEQPKTVGSSATTRLVPVLVLAIGCVISLLVWHQASTAQLQTMNSAFEYEKNKLVGRFEYSLEKQEDILKSIQDVYRDYVQIVRDVFELYAEFPTILYPGVQAICYAPRVSNEQREMFEMNAQMEGYFGYEIFPKETRDFYYPVLYAVPILANTDAIGYDILSDPERETAMTLAADHDAFVSTKKMKLSGINDSGLIVFAPIYNPAATPDEEPATGMNNTMGIVFIEIESDTFFTAVAQSGGTERNIEMCIYADTVAGPNALLYSSFKNEDPLVTGSRLFTFGGRSFLLEMQSSKYFELQNDSEYPFLMFFGGIVVSILFSLIAYLMLSVRRMKLSASVS